MLSVSIQGPSEGEDDLAQGLGAFLAADTSHQEDGHNLFPRSDAIESLELTDFPYSHFVLARQPDYNLFSKVNFLHEGNDLVYYGNKLAFWAVHRFSVTLISESPSLRY